MAVTHGKVKARIALASAVQDGLRTDRLCIFKICVSTSFRDIIAAGMTLQYYSDHNLTVVLVFIFNADSIALFILIG